MSQPGSCSRFGHGLVRVLSARLRSSGWGRRGSETVDGSASQSMANQPHDDIRPAGATAANLSDARQGAREKKDPALKIPASETADTDLQRQGDAQRRQVLQRSQVAAVANSRSVCTQGTFLDPAHSPETSSHSLLAPDRSQGATPRAATTHYQTPTSPCPPNLMQFLPGTGVRENPKLEEEPNYGETTLGVAVSGENQNLRLVAAKSAATRTGQPWVSCTC
jgi:hypothetical protein